MKEYDAWNSQKKDIENTTTLTWPKRRDIRWCRLGLNVGSEQDGAGTSHERPAVIIKVFSNGTSLVAPTTRKPANRFRFDLEEHGHQSRVLCDQLRVVSNKRLTRKVDELPEEIFVALLETIRHINGLDNPPKQKSPRRKAGVGSSEAGQLQQ